MAFFEKRMAVSRVGIRPAMAFAYNEQDKQLEIEVQRRNPRVTASQVMLVRVEPGVVKYRAQLQFEVLYSGVDTLRVDVPEEFASQIQLVEGFPKTIG